MAQIDVKILDREFRLAVDPEEKPRLLEAVRMVDDRMRNLREGGRVIGIERIAVMAALQFAHELLGGDNSAVGPKSAEMARKLRQLSEDIDTEIRRQENLF
ncbi:MAG: cell division protein ZapA [Burkholderiaceae bacterium]